VPWPSGWELWELALQAGLSLLLFCPRPIQVRGCRLAARLLTRAGSSYRRQLAQKLPLPLEQRSGEAFAISESEAKMLQERVLALRGALFPRWTRPLRVTGVEHVRAALHAHHGAILWVQPCAHSSIAVKQALWQAGLPLAHLTRPAHGFSPRPFGIRIMNPFLRRSENRFLRERIVIDPAHTVAPLRRLRVLLAANQPVSITVTSMASSVAQLPFLGGRLLLPDGPVQLAATTGAALLPVYTRDVDGVATVEVGPPLPVNGRTPAAIRHCQEACRDWLKQRVDLAPLDWAGWRSDIYERE
jgi:lauroyl/myristoyl acyltransferase